MILILAGTAEARQLAQQVADAGLPAVASLAGVTRAPKSLAVPVVSGGFGGDAGFAQFLKAKDIRQVIDATHPFAATMTERAARICQGAGIRYVRLSRPEWAPQNGDDWRLIDGWAGLADHLTDADRIFFATGRQSELSGYRGKKYLRVVEPIEMEGVSVIVQRPPFSLADEIALFQDLRITHLVTKNAGGDRPAKLNAAARLGVPVLMIRRPSEPNAEVVRTVSQAFDWIEK